MLNRFVVGIMQSQVVGHIDPPSRPGADRCGESNNETNKPMSQGSVQESRLRVQCIHNYGYDQRSV